MKKILVAILVTAGITAGITFGLGVQALPTTIYQRNIFPAASSTYRLGTSTLYWLEVITKNLELKGALKDGAGVTGTSGLVLSSTGTSTKWVADSTGVGTFVTTSINGAVSTTFHFTTTSDTNIGLAITTSTDGVIFNPSWSGTLADGRITSAGNWNAWFSYPAAATSTFVQITATTSFPNLATVGTIGTGVWQGTLIDILRGGTNSSTVGSAGCVKYSDGTRLNCSSVGTEGYFLMSMGASTPLWANSTTLPYLGLGYPATATSSFLGVAYPSTATSTFMQISATTSINFDSPSITVASTSFAVGATTTILLGPAVQAETWLFYSCYTDTATATVQFGVSGGAYVTAYFASSTGTLPPTTTLSANNTFAIGAKRAMQIGNVVNSPNYIACSIKKQY